jgi:hypothetical protein
MHDPDAESSDHVADQAAADWQVDVGSLDGRTSGRHGRTAPSVIAVNTDSGNPRSEDLLVFSGPQAIRSLSRIVVPRAIRRNLRDPLAQGPLLRDRLASVASVRRQRVEREVRLIALAQQDSEGPVPFAAVPRWPWDAALEQRQRPRQIAIVLILT